MNFGKGDHEILASERKDFVLEKEMMDDDAEENETSNDIVEEERLSITKEDHAEYKHCRNLASVYAELIKDIGVILTFSLAFPFRTKATHKS